MVSLEDWHLRRFEKKMKRMKPKLLEKWYNSQYEEIESRLEKEYSEELDRAHTNEWDLSNKLKSSNRERDEYKHKYEAIQETQDKLIEKVAKTSQDKGQFKQEVKQLKEEVSELKEATQDTDEEQITEE